MLFDFEKPIEELQKQIEKAKETQAKGKVNMLDTIEQLENKVQELRKTIYNELNGWQNFQPKPLPDRPYSLDYIEGVFKDFIELHGDRNVADDKAMIGGLGEK